MKSQRLETMLNFVLDQAREILDSVSNDDPQRAEDLSTRLRDIITKLIHEQGLRKVDPKDDDYEEYMDEVYSLISKLDQLDKSVKYTMNRDIRVGSHYRINSSYGYAGIDNGVIKVVSIRDTDQLPLYEDVEAWADDMDGILEDKWVGYKYDHNGDDDPQYMPLSIFVEHISMV